MKFADIIKKQLLRSRSKLAFIMYKFYLKMPPKIKNIIRKVLRHKSSRQFNALLQTCSANQFVIDFINKLSKVIDKERSVFYIQPTIMNFFGFDFFCGGAERYALDLNKLFAEQGYDFYCIQYSTGSPWVRYYCGLTIIGLPDCNNQAEFNHYVFELTKNAELVISSPFTLVSKGSAKKIIGICHGIYWDTEALNSCANLISERIKYLDKLVTVDTATINFIRSHHVVYIDKLHYIPNYVDHEKFSIKQKKDSYGEIIILYPRRLYPPRGFWVLYSIIPQILAEFVNVSFIFCGKGNDLEIGAVNRLVDRYKGKVKHIISLPDEMPHIYQQADIIVIPTVNSEGASLSLIEAMASKKAIITTYVGGLTDLITDRFNGFMIRPGNSDELYCAIKELILNKNLRQQIAQNAYQKSLVFDITHWKQKWLKLIRDVIVHKETIKVNASQVIGISLLHMSAGGVIYDKMMQRPQHLFLALSLLGLKSFFIEDRAQDYQYLVNKNLVIAGNKTRLDFTGMFLYTYFADNYDVIRKQKYKGLVYDVLDDPSIHNSKLYMRKHLLMLKMADIILTSSKLLFVEYSRMFVNKIIRYVPNAANRSDFNNPTSIKPKNFPAFSNKTIGYYGAIAEWFDYKLLDKLCCKYGSCQFVLIGPCRNGFCEEELLMGLLKQHKNLFYLGTKKYEELSDYASYFDVSIIPFVDNEITKNCSPVKLFEYMNIGVPIVTTNMPECRKYKSALIAKNHQEFIDLIAKAFKIPKDDEYFKIMQQEAAENTWEDRAKVIIEAINENLNAK